MKLKEILFQVTLKVARKFFYRTSFHKSKLVNGIYKGLFLAAYGDQKKKDIVFHGKKFSVPTHDITIVPTLISGDYEQHELAVLKKILRPGDIFYDIGANLGVYSIIASDSVGEKGKIFAFEPVPGNISYLRENIAMNKCHNVEVIASAVGPRAGTLDIYIASDSIGTHSAANKSEHKISVPMISIDDFSTARGITPHVIKIDVEGYEVEAFKGMRNTLAKGASLFMEYIPGSIDFAQPEVTEIFDLICAHTSHIYKIIDHKESEIQPSLIAHLDYCNILFTNHPL